MKQHKNAKLLVAVAATIALGAGLTAAPATAATSVKVKGVLTLGGEPLAGAKVTLMRGDGDTGEGYERYKTVTTSSTGKYSVSFTPNKNWIYNRVIVQDPQHRAVTTDRWFKVRGTKTITRNVTLTRAATLTGKVTRADGSAATATRVSLGAGDTLGDWGDNTNIYNPDVSVAADGTYKFVGLPPGDYEVSYSDSNKKYLTQCFNNVLSTSNSYVNCASITTVKVASGSATTVPDQQLSHLGGRIRGTVTDTSGKPIKNVDVILASVGARLDQEPSLSSRSTGRYDWRPIIPGNVQLRAVDYSGRWASQWYGGTSRSNARTFAVTGGADISATDFKLKSRASISAKATGGKGKATFKVTVKRKATGGRASGKVTISMGGVTRTATLKKGTATLTLKGVAAGTWKVKVMYAGHTHTAAANKTVTAKVK